MSNQCIKCGKDLPENSTFCPHCGAAYGNNKGASLLLKVLSFLLPIVGWILYFIYKDDNIKKAKDCSNCAWWGFGVNILLIIFGLV